MAEIVGQKLTAVEFAALPETNTPMELIGGEVVVSPTPKDNHQAIAGGLHLALSQIIPGGMLRMAPLDVYLDDENVLQPDVFWVAADNPRCSLGEDGYWHGGPDLVVEVASPSTAVRDRREKFELYEAHGVREYWIVDPTGEYIEVWIRDGDKLVKLGIYDAADTFESPVLDTRAVKLKSIFGG